MMMQTNSTESNNDEDDDAFLQRLILPEEERHRLFPTTTWAGGYRWFRSPNVICLEKARKLRAEGRI
jgi:hypothetical protein